jgi:hypothetical protein
MMAIGRKDGPMAQHFTTNPAGSSGEEAAAPDDVCRPLEEKIEVITERVALLEEGLPQAPGAQKVALLKEIDQYRADLDALRRDLQRCRMQAE